MSSTDNGPGYFMYYTWGACHNVPHDEQGKMFWRCSLVGKNKAHLLRSSEQPCLRPNDEEPCKNPVLLVLLRAQNLFFVRKCMNIFWSLYLCLLSCLFACGHAILAKVIMREWVTSSSISSTILLLLLHVKHTLVLGKKKTQLNFEKEARQTQKYTMAFYTSFLPESSHKIRFIERRCSVF